MGFAVGPKGGLAVLLKIQTVSEDNFLRQQGLGYAGFGWERVQPENGMINELDEYELRHFFERKGVQVPAAPFFDESDAALDLGNVLFCGGGVDVEVWYERPNLLKLVVH